MRIAFISDLHSSIDALESVLADAQDRGVDEVICLGDVVDMGPDPVAVVERLRSLNMMTIRGNHDTLDEETDLDFLRAMRDWTIEQLSSEQLSWLRNLPFTAVKQVDGVRMLLVHGSPIANTQGITTETPAEELNQWLSDAKANMILAGHTHVAMVRRLRNGMAVNVGSTMIPFAEANVVPPQGQPFSDYAIVDIEAGAVSVEHRRLPFDLAALARAVKKSGMPHGDVLLGAYKEA